MDNIKRENQEKYMRIVFPMRVDAFTKRGGDTVQVEQYVAHLNRIASVKASIETKNDFDFSNVDIVHLVNIDRPLETYSHYVRAKNQNVAKICLSSIHHPYSWIDAFENVGRHGFLRVINFFFRGFKRREALKNIHRSIRNLDAAKCYWNGFFHGLHAQQVQILAGVDHCFLLAKAEIDFIYHDFGVLPKNYSVVPNAVDGNFYDYSLRRDIDVLVVGRIEERKNQILIVEALRDTGLKVCFIGALNKNNRTYIDKFQKLIDNDPFISYLGVIPHGDIAQYYARSKVHLNASWFEVTPLVDIEAFNAGCSVATTKFSFSREYFGERAVYVDAACKQSIKNGVSDALERYSEENIKIAINDWAAAAHSLYKVYLGLER